MVGGLEVVGGGNPHRALTYAVRRSAPEAIPGSRPGSSHLPGQSHAPVETTMTETRWPELPNPSPSCLWELSQLESSRSRFTRVRRCLHMNEKALQTQNRMLQKHRGRTRLLRRSLAEYSSTAWRDREAARGCQANREVCSSPYPWVVGWEKPTEDRGTHAQEQPCA